MHLDRPATRCEYPRSIWQKIFPRLNGRVREHAVSSINDPTIVRPAMQPREPLFLHPLSDRRNLTLWKIFIKSCEPRGSKCSRRFRGGEQIFQLRDFEFTVRVNSV